MRRLTHRIIAVGAIVSGSALSALAWYPTPYPYAAPQPYAPPYPVTPYPAYPYPVVPQPPIATYSYTPQPAYEEVEVYVPVITYEKRKAFRPVGVVIPGQLPTISTGQAPNISMSPGAVGVLPNK